MDLTLVLTITGVILSILIPLTGFLYKSRKELNNSYSLIWKSSSSLKPKDFLNERPYDEYYFERSIDRFLISAIENKKNALIVGPPLSGKTRAVYNALKNPEIKCDVLAVRSVPMSAFKFPSDLKFWKKKLIFIDDFQNFIEKQDSFPQLFKIAKEKNIPVIVTCHSGKEFTKSRNKLIENNIDIEILFGENIIELNKISVDEGKQIAGNLNLKWDSINFNGTIGSIFMKLSEMQRRYDQCNTIEKTILLSLGELYISGVFQDNCHFKIEWIKKYAEKYELSGKDFEWKGWLKNLEEKEFLQLTNRNYILAEDAYLEYIIKPEAESETSGLIEDVTELFKDNSEVLQMAGERAYDTGLTSINILDYLRLTIIAFQKVLNLKDQLSEQLFIKANKYIGMSYWSLSKVENTKDNCIKSIEHYSNILTGDYIKSDPYEFAVIKNKIGNTLTSLAENENRIENCKAAINSFSEALKVFTLDDYPSEYAQAYSNMGGAYLILSESENKSENLKIATECFEKALKIRTIKDNPKGFAFTKNNIGNTYANLSQIEEHEKNLKLALECYNDILQIYKKEKFPLQYGFTMNNIGNVFSFLADFKDRKENFHKAIGYYEKALEVRTADNAPVQYSSTMFNLGDVYLMLYETENKTEYLRKAIECLKESINIDPVNLSLNRMSGIYFLLGKAYTFLSYHENKKENSDKGMNAFNKALELIPKEETHKMREKIINEIDQIKNKFISN